MRLSILFTLLIFVSAKAGKKESLPTYTAGKETKDSSLKKDESRFNFSLVDRFSAAPLAGEIKFADNGINKKIKTDSKGKFSLVLKPGKHLFEVFYSSDYYEVKTDSIKIKQGYAINITIHFKSSINPVMEEKPVIYLHPKEKTEVKVNLTLKGKLNFTYPEYKSGWTGTANPDGKLEINGKKCDYLFWEGQTNLTAQDVSDATGFVVKKENTVKFLEEKLTEMGLSAREQTDFITYWAPQMMNNELNHLHFLFNEDFSKYAALNIEPKPDHVFRVFMVWMDASGDHIQNPVPQKIQKADRSGFSVIEWGGANLDKLNADHSTPLK